MNSLADVRERNQRERYAASIVGNMEDRLTYFAMLTPEARQQRKRELATDAILAVLTLIKSWYEEKAS